MSLFARAGSAFLAMLLFSQLSTVSSFAIGVSGSEPFGLSPSPDSQGLSRPYFEMQVLPGQSISDSVVVSDQGRSAETLLISAAMGVTATNSGTAFEGAFSPCAGISCWISGLPSSVTLSPGQSMTLPFSVNVPAGTAPSQYLAGITAKPAQTPGATVVGGNQQTSVNAIIIHEITIGVAISTGTLAQLSSKLVITGVTGTYIGTVPRLLVQVQNQGQRYAKGVGIATCSENGLTKDLPVNVNTILPGQTATVPVNAVQFKSVANCVVHLSYGTSVAATWTGSVKLPIASPSVQVPVAKGVYATVPPAKIPTWGVALLIGAGALVLLLLVLLLLSLRRRRRRRHAEIESRAHEGAQMQPRSQTPGDLVESQALRPDTSSMVETYASVAQSVPGGANGAVVAVATETLVAPPLPDVLEVVKEKSAKGSSKKADKRSSKKHR